MQFLDYLKFVIVLVIVKNAKLISIIDTTMEN